MAAPLSLIMNRTPTATDIPKIEAALNGLKSINVSGIKLKQGSMFTMFGGSGSDTWSADIRVDGVDTTILIDKATLQIPANAVGKLTSVETNAFLTQMRTAGLISETTTFVGGYRHKRSGRKSRKSKKRSSRKSSSRKSSSRKSSSRRRSRN